MSSDAVCFRCRRPLEPEPEGDVVLSLEGPVLLQALREARAVAEPAEAELVEALTAALCPGCGRAV